MSNRLAQATSPYLLQHADNPVDWQPWDEDALVRARREAKPILLSIGYSACHWCHVMAHESFEHEPTAELMNERFVSIKVDREERPDLDRIYQIAHQIMTRRPGGWPLTVMLDPSNLAPFFTGTYFPREARHGLPDFTTVLTRTADWYRDNASELDGQAERLREVFERIEPAGNAAQVPGRDVVQQAPNQFAQQFDAEEGGFGGAPKFPHPSSLFFLLNFWMATPAGDERIHRMVTFTLAKMARGGLFDQIGGGFYRYSVDQRWEIPHFEKMLYDNGPLLALYARAYQIEATPLFARAARATADWALREMRRAEGGFCASLDADAEGIEGGFYRWSTEEAQQLLGDDYALAAAYFGLDQNANFEGYWHLTARADEADLAQTFGLAPEQVREKLDAAQSRLFQARAKRAAPGRDDKVLTAWNALMIHGLAVAYQVFGKPEYLEAATGAVDFLREALWENGRLLASWRNGQAHLPAYLDDHAFLLDALLALLEVRWRTQDLEWARELADLLLARFEDRDRGGFHITADDHETLLYRPKTLADESLPSGNAVAIRSLLRLGYLLAEPRYLEAAERGLRLGSTVMAEQPTAHPGMLDSLALWLHEPVLVIVRGNAPAIEEWRDALSAKYAPRRAVFAIPAQTPELPAALADKPAPAEGGCVAYVCRGPRCSAPISRLNELLHQLG